MNQSELEINVKTSCSRLISCPEIPRLNLSVKHGGLHKSSKGRKACSLLLANLPILANTATSHMAKYPFPTILTDTWRPGIGGLHSAVQTSPAASCLTWSPHIGFRLCSVRIPTLTSKLERGLDRGPGIKRCALNYPVNDQLYRNAIKLMDHSF